MSRPIKQTLSLYLIVTLVFASALAGFLYRPSKAEAAFTFVQSGANSDQNDLTIALTGVGAGNLIVAWTKWEGASGGTGIASLSDGTSSFQLGTLQNNGTDMHGQFAYLLSANGGNKTYTLDINGTETWREWMIMEFSYTGTMSFDTQNVGSGNSGDATSGNITLTSGQDSYLVLGGISGYVGTVGVNGQTINNVAAEGFVNGWSPYGSLFYDALSSPFSNENAELHFLGGAQLWVANIIAFKATASPPASAASPHVNVRGGGSATNSNVKVRGGGGEPLIVTSGLVGHWKFNEGTGGTTADSSGNGNTGTISGATWTTGRFGAALDFSADSVSIANESNFDFDRTNPFSATAWIYRNNNTATHSIVAKQPNAGNFPGWFFNAANTVNYLEFRLRNSSGTEINRQTENVLSTGTWHHVAFTYDGSSSVAGMRIYIDGVDQSAAGSGTLTGSILNDQDVLIGNNVASGAAWDGVIDEVRVYNRTLSPAEVMDLYINGLGNVKFR